MFGNGSNGFWDPFAEFLNVTLPNGLTLHYARFPVNWMTFRFLVHVGAREDPPELPGLDHLLEHLVGENIPDISASQARALFQKWGEAPFLGEMGYLGTRYGFKAPCDYVILQRALSIFGSMLLDAKIAAGIDDQKAIIIEELHDEGRLRFVREVMGRSYAVQFPGHHLQTYRDEAGTIEAVQAATQSDLQGFYNAYYTPANIEVVAAGGMEQSALLRLLAASPLGQSRPGTRNPVLPPLPEIPRPEELLYRTSLSRNQRIVSSGQFENTQVFSRGVIPSWIPYEATRLFCNILEEVLYRVIREQETSTYGFFPDLRFRQEFNFLEIEGRIATEKAAKVQDTFSRCIDLVATDASLFEEFRDGMIGSLRMYDISIGDLVANVVDCLRITQRIPPLLENLAGYEKLILRDMQPIAEYLQPERRWTCILEP